MGCPVGQPVPPEGLELHVGIDIRVCPEWSERWIVNGRAYPQQATGKITVHHHATIENGACFYWGTLED